MAASHERTPRSASHLTGKVAVVTGGALGIGGGISRRLAASGALLVLNDISAEAAEETRADIDTKGGRCVVVAGDIREKATVARVSATALDLAGGGVDILVNNVGDFRPAARTFLHSTEQQWHQLYELNLLHVMRMCQALLPAMVERGTGAIVNNSTVEAFRGIPFAPVYSAFNAGVSAFTKSLAVDVAQYGVRVNAIAPDLADTPQTPAAAMLKGRDPDLIRTWIPAGRFGRPDDYAAVVEFLVSDDAGFVTGHTVPVDGGTLAASGWYARADRKGWTNMPNEA
ncbi:short-chain dehydrogenase [Prauserella marina]|uniref:NAD(P)-dependent dehydrogenase, short-chain alcohol dehydrogenase family n=1 Tax=Prauserella marina TaxID=530584 RepID=A0A222VRE5_9PSEU|nr:SDR family NAD(P)-dependent oxidoreductase [Prauserella marina]ASR36313.1 short-chain dehydrogenase [Prauserella marina]PWV77093.1 NAD(P)-dependent dehydrogenase (short-subunit alcohol dehydrogenase family) [Prauserella marina]SDD04251.1 NAD(P)-dependent dehydrogenase, short-chain alcohol dehydrogenase family [Prauserella marina]